MCLFNVLGLLAQMFQKVILKVTVLNINAQMKNLLPKIIRFVTREYRWGPNAPNGLGSNWQSKSPTKGLVWLGLIIPQAYMEKPRKAKKPNQSNPCRTPPTICMMDWFIIGMRMGNVCFGDDFWSDAREMGVATKQRNGEDLMKYIKRFRDIALDCYDHCEENVGRNVHD